MLSETQLLTIALATVPTILVVAIGILLNNHRLNDLKELFQAQIATSESHVLSQVLNQINAVENRLLSQMATYQLDIISKIAELDNRITRLER
jgi:hypothetical protein